MSVHHRSATAGLPNPWTRTAPLLLPIILSACAPIAGLEEHQPYPGFPDSKNVPCSDGMEFVACSADSAVFPQDGHLSSTPASYQISADQTEVFDPLTGLTWYRTPGAPKGHDEAAQDCAVLPGAYRLPTRIELVSLLSFQAGAKVLIDSTAFPDVAATPYWTSSRRVRADLHYWMVSFDPLLADLGEGSLVIGSDVSTHGGSLCVKDSGQGFEPGPFIILDDEKLVAHDARTGLVWTRDMTKPVDSWTDAIQFCNGVKHAGFTDYRLPNIKELSTIVDDRQESGDVPNLASLFTVMDLQALWSSTPSPTEGKFFALETSNGSVYDWTGTTAYTFVPCVRGPD